MVVRDITCAVMGFAVVVSMDYSQPCSPCSPCSPYSQPTCRNHSARTSMPSKQASVRKRPSHKVLDVCSQGAVQRRGNCVRHVALSERHRGTTSTPPRCASTPVGLCATHPVSNRMPSRHPSHLTQLRHSPASIAIPRQTNGALRPTRKLMRATPTPPCLHIHALHQVQVMKQFPSRAELTMQPLLPGQRRRSVRETSPRHPHQTTHRTVVMCQHEGQAECRQCCSTTTSKQTMPVGKMVPKWWPPMRARPALGGLGAACVMPLEWRLALSYCEEVLIV